MKKKSKDQQIKLDLAEIDCEQKKDTGVRELLEKLDMRKKVVLSLYYFEQLSVSEISIALKIPKGTVKSRLHSAREELKELWQRHSE